ncbi:hypothetical protein TNCV_4340031 [Trichonephila clavipes]|nr:hypothetical protein TNCV_4340031 [Trichonephila clavipes]
MNGDEYSLQMSRFSLSSDSHRILIWREREAAIIPRTPLREGTGAMGLQFLFMHDNAQCHRTVAAEQLLESEDVERMDWLARSRISIPSSMAEMPQ